MKDWTRSDLDRAQDQAGVGGKSERNRQFWGTNLRDLRKLESVVCR